MRRRGHDAEEREPANHGGRDRDSRMPPPNPPFEPWAKQSRGTRASMAQESGKCRVGHQDGKHGTDQPSDSELPDRLGGGEK